ncbi:MAG: ABC transporter ATP-binding protein [Paracoccaceae bacterium]
MTIISELRREYAIAPRRNIIAVLLLTLAERIIFLAPAILVGRIVDLVATGQATKVNSLLLVLLVLGAIQAILWPLREKFVAQVVQTIVLDRSIRLTATVFDKDYAIFASSRVGSVTKVVERAIEGFEQLSIVLLTQALPALVSVLLVSIYFLALLPIGAPVLAGGAIIYFVVSLLVLRWRRIFLDDVNDSEDDIADSFATTFLAARSIKSSGHLKTALSPLSKAYRVYADAAKRLALASGVLAAVQATTTLGVTILSIFAGIYWLDISDTFSAGDFVVVFSYVGIFMSNLAVTWKVREAYDEYDADVRALRQIQELPDVRKLNTNQRLENSSCLTVHPMLLPGPVELKIVKPIEIKGGDIVGIVGDSGAGKTLLLQAMAGIRTSNGVISIGGKEVDKFPADQLTKVVDFSWQEPQFLHGDWEEAVFFRKLTENERMETERLCSALGLSHIFANRNDEFRADSLSGGEKKRLALLRVFVDPAPILIFDEPTSELDADRAQAICDTLKGFSGKSTIIVATHDELVQSICDRLVTVKDGEVKVNPPLSKTTPSTRSGSHSL